MPLRKITEIELAGERFDIARGENGYSLVRNATPDAYGRPVAFEVPLAAVELHHVDSLIDLLGQALEREQARADLRRAEGGA